MTTKEGKFEETEEELDKKIKETQDEIDKVNKKIKDLQKPFSTVEIFLLLLPILFFVVKRKMKDLGVDIATIW